MRVSDERAAKWLSARTSCHELRCNDFVDWFASALHKPLPLVAMFADAVCRTVSTVLHWMIFSSTKEHELHLNVSA